MAVSASKLVELSDVRPGKKVLAKVKDFLKKLPPLEVKKGAPLALLYDERSKAHYLICHQPAQVIVSKTDTDAVLDPDESDEYKLNRDIYTDTYAYKVMEQDAVQGRSFEDIVAEYDASYRSSRPLKIYGGQHRVTAIREAMDQGADRPHGLRIYFDLSTEQRLEIATVNNTSIAVSNDLLDRMQEEWLGSELRSWCQDVGLLEDEQNFADKRSSAGTPTVRVARTLVVNYFRGKGSKIDGPHEPKVCQSGAGIDADYEKLRKSISWSDKAFAQMGQQFSRLHEMQRERVTARETDAHQEFANKAIHPCVAAAWGYAAGLFANDSKALKTHYSLTDSVSSKGTTDPLNAKALSTARLKGVDPDTYRGLGARISTNEIRRMLELFILQATKAKKRGITTKLANAAIQSFEAKKAQLQADKAIKGI